MMYIVLTAMLALNVASEVLEAFRIVDKSLLQTLQIINQDNVQIYSSFDQAYSENPNKVGAWKGKADELKNRSSEMVTYVSLLKDTLVNYSGTKPVNADNPISDENLYHVTINGDTLQVGKEDDLNGPSEYLITQKNAEKLKNEIEKYRDFLITLIDENDSELRDIIYKELDTSNPDKRSKGEGNYKSWESEHFEDKPLTAILTLLSKIQIDIKYSEVNVAKYLYGKIDEGSFKFNRLGARVIAKSGIVFMGDDYSAEVFLAAEDTTQQPEIFINGRKYDVKNGKATYKVNTSKPGVFKWNGIIKYKTPEGTINDYPFKAEYQVTQPSVTMSATKMNVFYKGLKNPFEVGGGGIPTEDLEISMTNGKVTKNGNGFFVEPKSLDQTGKSTKVSVYANIGGQRRLVGTTNWRVKKVPDPVAKINGKSGGTIKKEVLKVQDGVLAVLEDFDFEFKYTVTQFTLETSSGGYVNRYTSKSNRFTGEQKEALKRVGTNSYIYIGDIQARGDDGSVRDLAPIGFKVK